MTHARNLTELLVELYRRLNGREPEPELAEAIQTLREENSLDQDDQVPAWLTAVFTEALAGREVEHVLFPKIGSAIASFLFDASREIPGWEHDSQGEWIDLRFPAIGMLIHLSREALTPDRRHSCAYSVRRLSS